MSKKILLAVLTVSVVTLLAGMATYAYFSDTASSTGNRFQAGTMNLVVDGTESMSAMSFSPVSPGWTGSKSYTVLNEGTVNGALVFDANNLVEDAGAYPSGEAAVQAAGIADLAANLYVVVKVDGVAIASGTVADLVAAGPLSIGYLWAGDDVVVSFDCSVASSVGNEIMGDSLTFDALFDLTSVPM